MTDKQIDRLVRSADRYDAAAVRDLHGADQALLEEIMSAPPIEQLIPPRRRQRSLRNRLVVGVAAAAVLTAMAGGAALLTPDDEGGGAVVHQPRQTQIAYTAAAIKAAEKNPRLLIDQPGWVATTVYGFTKDNGTIEFTDGDRRLEMNWYRADQYDVYYNDRLGVSAPEPASVAGQEGALFTYNKSDFAIMAKPQDGSFVELRTGGQWTRADFLAVVSVIEKVDVDTWLAALPPEVVKPDGARNAVASMLADIPQPPGFEAAKLEDLGPSDRYQLGAEVTHAVTCGWIEEWQRATDAGDTAARTRAIEALQSSHHWKVLDEMNPRGDMPEVIWGLADRLAAGDTSVKDLGMLDCS